MNLAAVETSKYRLDLIPPQFCVDLWPQIRDYIRPAVDRSGGRWTMEHILSGLILGQQGLWVVYDQDKIVGALTTEVVTYPAKRMLAIHFLGGENMNEWYWTMSDAMIAHAKQRGCSGIETTARAGFWKWFKDDGFKRSSVFYEREV